MKQLTIREYVLEIEPMRFLDVQMYSKELRRSAGKIDLLSTLGERYSRELKAEGNIEEITAKIEDIENQKDVAETVLFGKMLEIARNGIKSIKNGEQDVEKDVIDGFSTEEIGQVNDVVLGNITKKN